MKCEYCENEVPAGVNRCPSCGASLQNRVSQDDSKGGGVCTPSTTPLAQPMALNAVRLAFNAPYLHVAKKSRVAYIVLAIFLGELGIHNFYAGYAWRGVAQLLITILSFGLLFWISWIWALVELCVMTNDGRGVPFD